MTYKNLFIKWETNGKSDLDKTVQISDEEYNKLKVYKGFPNETDPRGDDAWWDSKHPLQRPKIDGVKADAVLIIS